MALKPLRNPVVGTYWKTETDKYEPVRKNNPKMVAVVATERKYARMGIQECFVSFVSAVEYATKQPQKLPYRMELSLFMDLFERIPDEELGNVLGLEILAFYD
jgi:hypothetical protein